MAQEKKVTYYLPVYEYRSIAGVSTALSDIVQNIMRGEKTTLYKSEKKAEKIAQSMLCDDDTCAVVTVKITSYSCDNDYITLVRETPHFKDMVCLHLWGFLKDWCEIK